MIAILRALSLTDWYYVLGIGALISGALLFSYRKAVHPLYRYFRKHLDRVTNAIESVEKIRAEVFKNGGKSMRDSVDRTERIMVEMAKDVSMSVAQNRSLFEQNEISMFEGDEEGAIVWANRALRKLTGMRLEQIIGSGWINAVHDDDRRRVENDWMLATANRRPFIQMFRITHIGTGVVTPVHCEANPVFADGGVGSGWLGLIRLREIDP